MICIRRQPSNRPRSLNIESLIEVEPVWNPLEMPLGGAKCVGFMFIGRVNSMNRYKHGITRTSLYLDDSGHCYLPDEGGVFTDQEIGTASWPRWSPLTDFGWTLPTPYDQDFVIQKKNALREQGLRC